MKRDADSVTEVAKARQSTRRRPRNERRKELELAVKQIKSRGQALTVTAVANEVGVTPALIHNTYPDIAEDIRKQTGRSTEQRLEAKVAELEVSEVGSRQVRADLAQASADIARLASLNESLREEVATLKAAASGKIVPITGRARPT